MTMGIRRALRKAKSVQRKIRTAAVKAAKRAIKRRRKNSN
jgi:hypothetical protein